VVNRVIVFIFIHAQDNCQILALGRCRNDDFLGSSALDVRVCANFACSRVALGISEDAGAFKNDIHAEIFPRQLARIFFGKNFDFGAIDYQVASFIDFNVTLIDAIV